MYIFNHKRHCYDSTFKTTDTKLYVPVTLKTEDNKKLSKLLREGFKRPIYWNEYKITPNKNYDVNKSIRERLDTSIQGVEKLLVLATLQKIVTENMFF